MADDSQGSGDWFTWAQDMAKQAVSGVLADRNAKRQQDYELAKLRLQALGADGGLYSEGQPKRSAASGDMSGTVLLIGAALVAVMLLKD